MDPFNNQRPAISKKSLIGCARKAIAQTWVFGSTFFAKKKGGIEEM
jgi:hypothetical protein